VVKDKDKPRGHPGSALLPCVYTVRVVAVVHWWEIPWGKQISGMGILSVVYSMTYYTGFFFSVFILLYCLLLQISYCVISSYSCVLCVC